MRRLLVLAALLVALPAGAVTFYVDSTADAPDADPGDGVCADATGACTLPAAIGETNELAGADEIRDCTYDDDGDPGTPEVPLLEDQRGEPRPFGSGCDIGAFEVPEPAHALLVLTGGLVLAAARRKRRA